MEANKITVNRMVDLAFHPHPFILYYFKSFASCIFLN